MIGTDSPTPHLTRGYLIALGAAAILSTTAIFIRHLTQTYQIPSLVLAFWRDVFVVLTLLPVLALVRPALVRVARAHLPYLVAVRLGAGGLQLAVDALGRPERRGRCHGAGLLSAGFSALLGWWFLQEGLGWAKLLAVACSLGGCVLVSAGSDPAAWRANCWASLTGRALRPELRRLQPDGPLGLPARAQPLDDPAVHLRLCRGLPAARQPAAGRAPAGLGHPAGRPPLAGEIRARVGHPLPARGGPDRGGFRAIHCQPGPPGSRASPT